MSKATSDKGRPRLATVVALDGLGESALLALAASTLSGSQAPLAAAILKSARERNARIEEPGGSGLQARVVLGDAKLFAQLGISIEGLSEWPDRLKRHGQQTLFVAVHGRTVGFLGVTEGANDRQQHTAVMEDENA
jgi:cation transport ATPase